MDIPRNSEEEGCAENALVNPEKYVPLSAGDSPCTFKKPADVGSLKRSTVGKAAKPLDQNDSDSVQPKDVDHPVQDRARDQSFSYVEPSWGGMLNAEYNMEILKSGIILGTISLSERSFYVVGRLPSCDLCLAHPTISRYHAILQYRSIEDGANSRGLYVYDLDSTHGTFWNGSRIKPNIYVRVRGGHILKFGCSQRKYILQAPSDDMEEESGYSITELKQKRALELETQLVENKLPPQEQGKQLPVESKEPEGIDWGMGEDADETTDLDENPYASIGDENLILDDPKKTLRGWFEREGYDLQYQTEEKGIGQFLCWVDLPVESISGRSVRAEAMVKGKKKEAVVQCAMEACRILDKYGLLRQANHEARKRKTRNWEEDDYYDSDEDNFLDRTGSVEKKREQRMRLAGRLSDTVETYGTLLKKHEAILEKISLLSDSIKQSQETSKLDKFDEQDELDAYMSTLKSSTLSKADLAKMKTELQKLRKEEVALVKLVNLTRPANMPPLISQTSNDSTSTVPTALYTDEMSLPPCSTTEVNENLLTSHPAVSSCGKAKDPKEKPVEDFTEESENEASQASANASLNGASQEQQPSKATKPRERGKGSRSESGVKKELECGTKIPKELPGKGGTADIYKEKYSTWVPPENQVGDGKTSLNEKYGY